MHQVGRARQRPLLVAGGVSILAGTVLCFARLRFWGGNAVLRGTGNGASFLDWHLSGQLTLWDQRGSKVIRGNVLARAR